MDLKDILTISGFPGLFKMVSQGKNAVIVENLETGKRMPAHARYRISSLEDIAVFTEIEDKPLKDILLIIFEKEEGKAIETPKKMSGDQLKAFFEEIVPDYDKDRVYVSDMKKALEWYNILIQKDMIKADEEVAEESEEKSSDKQEKAEEEESNKKADN